MRRLLVVAALAAVCPGFIASARADTVALTLVDIGLAGGTQTRVFSANLTGLGITQVGAITLVDDGTLFGGADGIFSGFDLDAVFLDLDGNLATSGDRTFASSFLFTAGTTRPTGGDANLEPNGAHPGPTFGSLDATTIDLATATLNVLDGVPVANVNTADGFLTLGDGGTLIANFNPEVAIGGTLFLLAGEVGGQDGEGLGANVFVSTEPIPEPGTFVLFGLAAAGAYVIRRRRKAS